MGAVSDDMFTEFFAHVLDPELGCVTPLLLFLDVSVLSSPFSALLS